MPQTSNVINAHNVNVKGRFSFDEKVLFNDINFHAPAVQWTSVVGKSGIGKSTLLKLIGGLKHNGVFTGHIVASDNTINIQQNVAWMGQQDLLMPWFNVIENVTIGQILRKEAINYDKATNLLAQMGLKGYSTRSINTLSGGMRQRVALARTLMEDKPIILMDEPFSALDTITRNNTQNLAWRMLKGHTVIMITHDPFEAIRLSHNIYVMAFNKRQNTTLITQPNIIQKNKTSLPLHKDDDSNLLYMYRQLINIFQ